MTLAAGLRQVLLVHRRQRIARRQHIMKSMARGAVGHCQAAKLLRQTMKTLHVRLHDLRRQLVPARDAFRAVTLPARLRNMRTRNFGTGFFDCLNRVFAVTIHANRGVPNATGNRLAVHAALVGVLDVIVTLAAGAGNVLPVKLRGRVGGLVQIVRPVTIRADRRLRDTAFLQRHAVHAAVVRRDWGALIEIELLHLRGIAMATTAGLRNVRVVDRRQRVPVVQQRMRVSVTILA